MNNNSFFIVLEGIDGSGKGTQSKRLFEEIENGKIPDLINASVKLTMEPTEGLIGKLIRKYLRNEKMVSKEQRALLFAADRLDNLFGTVIPTLNKNGIVISERYVYSSLAYQFCENIDFEWLCQINQLIIPPDLTILLDIDPTKSLLRFKSDSNDEKRKWEKQEYFEKKLFLLEQIRETYLEIFQGKIRNKYNLFDTNFVIVDASKSQDEVFERIKEHINSLIKGEYPNKSSKYLIEKQYNLEKYVSKTLYDFF